MSQFAIYQPSSHVPPFQPQPYDGRDDLQNTTEESQSSNMIRRAAAQQLVPSNATGQGEEDYPSIKQYNYFARGLRLMTLNRADLAEPTATLASATSMSSLRSAGSSLKSTYSLFLHRLFHRASSPAAPTGERIPLQTLKPVSKTLETIARLGGVAVLRLDTTLCVPKDLLLPNCLYLCLSYLRDQVTCESNIFRTLGNVQKVNALYDHLTKTLRTGQRDMVDQTVGPAALPTSIEFSTHDVASTFKKLVKNIPGGILGSTGLFLLLRDIEQNFVVTNDRRTRYQVTLKYRMIALAITSVPSPLRYAVICAVLSFVAMMARNCKYDCHGQAESFSRTVKTLSTIFAPLLLSDLQEAVDVSAQNNRGGLAAVPTAAPRPRKAFNLFHRSKRADFDDADFAQSAADYARYHQCARVLEMLLVNWKEVNKYLMEYNSPGSSPIPEDSSANNLQDTNTVVSPDCQAHMATDDSELVPVGAASDSHGIVDLSAPHLPLPRGSSRPSRPSNLDASVSPITSAAPFQDFSFHLEAARNTPEGGERTLTPFTLRRLPDVGCEIPKSSLLHQGSPLPRNRSQLEGEETVLLRMGDRSHNTTMLCRSPIQPKGPPKWPLRSQRPVGSRHSGEEGRASVRTVKTKDNEAPQTAVGELSQLSMSRPERRPEIPIRSHSLFRTPLAIGAVPAKNATTERAVRRSLLFASPNLVTPLGRPMPDTDDDYSSEATGELESDVDDENWMATPSLEDPFWDGPSAEADEDENVGHSSDSSDVIHLTFVE